MAASCGRSGCHHTPRSEPSPGSLTSPAVSGDLWVERPGLGEARLCVRSWSSRPQASSSVVGISHTSRDQRVRITCSFRPADGLSRPPWRVVTPATTMGLRRRPLDSPTFVFVVRNRMT